MAIQALRSRTKSHVHHLTFLKQHLYLVQHVHLPGADSESVRVDLWHLQ
jgi:hypothetical protein